MYIGTKHLKNPKVVLLYVVPLFLFEMTNNISSSQKSARLRTSSVACVVQCTEMIVSCWGVGVYTSSLGNHTLSLTETGDPL